MRFRPRFSIRTLAIFVTLVCAYFGAWEATKRYGLERGLSDDLDMPLREESPAPFIVLQSGSFEGPRKKLSNPYRAISTRTRIYIWFFGLKIKFPLEWPPT